MHSKAESFRLTEYDGSPWLKADDLVSPRTTLTIRSVEREEVGRDAELKAVVTFEEERKRLILNKTNVRALKQRFGANVTANDLVGKRVTLVVRSEDCFGEFKKVVRISPDEETLEGLSHKG
jgi:hypothetical protein